VAAEWVAKAEEDLKTAAQVLKLGEGCPTAAVCFHAQQCAEKYLKAYLVFRGTAFPKTHEIEDLVARMPERDRPALTVEEQALLTEYAVGPRYPGWRDVPLGEARRAVALARRVRKHVRSLLPKEALRPRRD
jgi:HEPN domain-containing protein